LTHESSLPCSFQRSEGRDSRASDRDGTLPANRRTKRESASRGVPSKLSSTADSIDRVGLDLYRDAVSSRRRRAQTKRETFRAKILSSTLAIIGRRTPGSASLLSDLFVVRSLTCKARLASSLLDLGQNRLRILFGIVCGRHKYVRYSVSGDR
jgi:hypothetical protein